ncbi:PhoB family transcriptional regulator [Brevibacillus sp. SKDU10]|uniref:response regulator transcription factor n=1 Tax=Brevibacillus sp. SKDU10 TaxID=1247872 RepID=UPI0007C8F8F4|nr:response regulator transcription factor [Brevibacillus sp. SKDU10]OAJ74523.1 PhoB family transcriptional regulator [Brevibacillus sp. SKDU10]
MSPTDSKGSFLLVEDEKNLARYLQLELMNEGYKVEICYDGEIGLEKALHNEYDLILLDVMIPQISGIEVCRRIRDTGSEVPIIMLTARNEVQDIVAGLDSGANDYLTKPFAIEELFARIRANLRPVVSKNQEILNIGTLEIQVQNRRVFRDTKEILLTPREFDLLLYLANHQGQALTREQLLTAVWGFDFMGNTNVVDVYIRYLRNKIERKRAKKLIHTIRGVGYSLRVE